MRAGLLLAGLLLAGGSHAATLTISKSERKINLKSQIVKVTDTIEVAASGGDASEVLLCWPERLAARIARMRVTSDKDKFDAAPAPAPAGAPPGTACFSAPVALKAGASRSVEAVTSLTGALAPNPAKIGQGEQQYMVYEDTLWPVSPYKIEAQSTVALTPTGNIASFEPANKASLADGKVTWDKSGGAAPWTVQPLKLHFEFNKSVKKVVKLVREVEVSHWGNIYVEESYIIQNAGAEHKGQFSRLRFAYDSKAQGNSFQVLKARLPAAAHSLYYRDLIGNISSSNTRKSSKETVVDLSLRYPLMGGWKTDFVLGYSLPLEGFLYNRPKGRRRLILDVSSPIDDVTIEELETRVVLPEGAQNIKHTLPFDMDVSSDKKFTYLDTVGRPVLVLRRANVIPVMSRPFAVDYSFGTGALLREPLLLITVFAALFAACALYNRLELTISKDDKWREARARERAGAALGALGALWDKEAAAVDQITRVTDALTDSGGLEAAAAVRGEAEAALKALEAQVKPLLDDLDVISAKTGAAARAHSAAGRALQERAVKLLSDKADLLRKGTPGLDAGKRVGPAADALRQARAEWAAAGDALID